MKKAKPERIRRRSSQSDFSRAVTSCLEVPIMFVNASCVDDVDFIVAVDESISWSMAAYDDSLLSFLRRGRYEKLTRFDGLESGLFAGEKSQINDAIAGSLGDAKLGTYKTIIEAIHPDQFKVEKSDAIAHYDRTTIKRKYQTLESQYADDPLKAQRSLIKLVNAHLHYMRGLAVALQDD